MAAQLAQQNGGNPAGSPGVQVRPQQAGGNAVNGNFANMQSNVGSNLHIPANKQRNLQAAQNQALQAAQNLQNAAQSAGSPAPMNAGSPNVRPPMPMNANQAGMIQRMINQGIPVNGSQNVGRSPIIGQPNLVPGVNFPQQQMPGAVRVDSDTKPYMILQQMTAGQGQQLPMDNGHQMGGMMNMANRLPQNGQIRQLSEQSGMNGMPMAPTMMLDRSASLLSKVSWAPSAEHDQALKESLGEFRRPLRAYGRSTLTQGFGLSRVVGDVVLERMPDGLRAIAEEADDGVADDDENATTDVKGGKTKAETLEGNGLPGQKRRKVSELAVTVDRALQVDHNVETVSLEVVDLISRTFTDGDLATAAIGR